jgi:hypothetical protein
VEVRARSHSIQSAKLGGELCSLSSSSLYSGVIPCVSHCTQSPHHALPVLCNDKTLNVALSGHKSPISQFSAYFNVIRNQYFGATYRVNGEAVICHFMSCPLFHTTLSVLFAVVFAKLQIATISFVTSVCPSICPNETRLPNRRILIKFDIQAFFRQSVEKNQVLLKSEKKGVFYMKAFSHL